MSAPTVAGSVIQFPVVDDSALKREAAVSIIEAQALTVRDAATYARASEFAVGLRTLAKRITEYLADDIARAFALHRSLTSKRTQAVAPLEAEVSRLGREMAAWDAQQRQLQRAEEARLARAQQERDRQIALEEAALLEAQGQHAEADQVIEQAIAMPAPTISLPPAVPKTEGISYRSEWRFEVVDPALVPREYLSVDETKIRGVVRSLKGLAKIAGVRVYEERVPVVRAS